MIIERSKLTRKNFDFLLESLLTKITVVFNSQFSDCESKATELIGDIDPKDIPFLACALCLNLDGIWSNDKDFNNESILNKVRVFNTRHIIERLR